MLNLQPTPKVITFDCHGTLVQWHAAVEAASRTVLAAHVSAVEAEDRSGPLADRLRAAAMVRQGTPPYCGYRSILLSSLAEALSEADHTATDEDG